jgi:hypothetical protein
MGEFDKARTFFDRSLEIPYEYRDVSDSRINLEKDRADLKSKEYP